MSQANLPQMESNEKTVQKYIWKTHIAVESRDETHKTMNSNVSIDRLSWRHLQTRCVMCISYFNCDDYNRMSQQISRDNRLLSISAFQILVCTVNKKMWNREAITMQNVPFMRLISQWISQYLKHASVYRWFVAQYFSISIDTSDIK